MLCMLAHVLFGVKKYQKPPLIPLGLKIAFAVLRFARAKPIFLTPSLRRSGPGCGAQNFVRAFACSKILTAAPAQCSLHPPLAALAFAAHGGTRNSSSKIPRGG